MSRIFFSAGESSGDLHGANLIRALRAADPAVECAGLGGARMAQAGMALRHDLAGNAIMGFTEVVKNFNTIRRIFLDTAAYLQTWRPHGIVLIDYPGFNLRLAARANAAGIPVIYYISPQVWAWKKKRIHTIARLVKKMLVIFPFEETLYREIGVNCTYVGHPLLDHLTSIQFTQEYQDPCVIALLPGSRQQEIQRILPVMLGVAHAIQKQYPHARFIIPCVDKTREQQIQELLQAPSRASSIPAAESANTPAFETVAGKTYQVLAAARFGLVASGTATLEAAILGMPMAILYKTSPLNYWLARRLIRVPYIGLANILAGKNIIPEFIQHNATPEAILPTALELIGDTPRRAQMLRGLAQVRATLGEPGASQRAAQQILENVRPKREYSTQPTPAACAAENGSGGKAPYV